jgi:hypothetical protein
MTSLSRAAQAVMDATDYPEDLATRIRVGAALRAAADQVVPETGRLEKEMFSITALRHRWLIRDQLLAIAAELEGSN